MSGSDELERQVKEALRAEIATLESQIEVKRRKLAALEGVELSTTAKRRVGFYVDQYLKLKGGSAPREAIVAELKRLGVAKDRTSLRNDQDRTIRESIRASVKAGRLSCDEQDVISLNSAPKKKP